MQYPTAVKMVLVLVTLLVTTSMQSLSAQIGSPFDLAPRLDTTKIKVAPTQTTPEKPTEQSDVTKKRNPFDLVRPEANSSEQLSKVKSILQLPSVPTMVEDNESVMSRGSFDTILCFVLLVILALASVLLGGPIRKMFNAAFNANMLSQLQRESRKYGYIIWAVLGVVLVGVFFFVSTRHLYPTLTSYTWKTLGWFILAALGLTALKLVVLNVLKLIFPLAKPVEAYQTLILVFAGVMGLCVFPALILICFSAPGLATAIVYIGIGFIATSFLLRSLRALGNSIRYISGYPFHFLLYICGLEIGPLAVALKLLTA